MNIDFSDTSLGAYVALAADPALSAGTTPLAAALVPPGSCRFQPSPLPLDISLALIMRFGNIRVSVDCP